MSSGEPSRWYRSFELKLKPAMTASIRIQVAARSGVLRIANGALRFRPTAEIFAALGQAAVRPAAPGSRVWMYANAALTAVPVRTGISDGTSTELLDSSLEVGARLVTGVNVDGSSAGSTWKTTSSPLTGGRSPMGGGPPGPPPM